MANNSVETRLKNINRWNFVPGKNKILPVLETLIANDEIIITVIDGFFNGTSEKNSGVTDSGVVIVSDRRIILIRSAAPDRYISLKKNNKLNISCIKNFSSLTLMIESGKDSYSFTTDHSMTELARDLSMQELPGIAGGQTEIDIYGTDISKQISPSENIEKNSTMTETLTSEIKRLTEKIGELKKNIHEKNFMQLFRDDIYTLTAMCRINRNEFSNNEMFLLRTLLSETSDSSFHGTGSIAPENIKSSIDDITSSPEKNLRTFEYLNAYDKEHNTGYSDIMAAVYYEYSHCLLKSDGIITGEEEQLFKDISAFIRKWKNAESSASVPEAEGEETIEQVMEKINSLIGMQNIKDEIKSFINYVNIMLERQKRKLPATPLSLHVVFYGPPGTGKTTIARLLGRVYKALGLLKGGHLIETDRSGLVAGYVGQTAIKTDELVSKAEDGVLFIDEAYTLIPENSTNDFGREAVDTILKRMEDMRDRFAVIAAGYTDEMERFIKSNPGLKSRFSRYHYFDHYSPDELVKIFHVFSDNVEFKLTEDASNKLKDIITHFYNLKEKNFGNARFVRNIFDKIVQNQADRLAALDSLTAELLCGIEKDDIPEIKDFSPERFS